MAVQDAVATFTGNQPLDGDNPYVDVTWDVAYGAAADYIITCGPCLSEVGGPVTVNMKSKTGAGVRVIATDQFNGTVPLIAIPVV